MLNSPNKAILPAAGGPRNVVPMNPAIGYIARQQGAWVRVPRDVSLSTMPGTLAIAESLLPVALAALFIGIIQRNYYQFFRIHFVRRWALYAAKRRRTVFRYSLLFAGLLLLWNWRRAAGVVLRAGKPGEEISIPVVLVLLAVAWLVALALRTKKLIYIADFAAFGADEKEVKGGASQLANELIRLGKLFAWNDAELAGDTRVSQEHAPVSLDDPAADLNFLTSDRFLKIGSFEISFGWLFHLYSLLARAQKLQASVHVENGSRQLLATLSRGRRGPIAWCVTGASGENGTGMREAVQELALRIFVDVLLPGSVSWLVMESMMNGIEALQEASRSASRTNANLRLAEKHFLEATHHDSSFARAWYLLGLTYRRLPVPASAQAAFRKAVELQPEDADAYYLWAASLIQKSGNADAERIDEPLALSSAERVCTRAVQIDPAHLRSWSLLGIVQRRRGDNRRALESHTKAVALACGRLFLDFDNESKKSDAVWALSNLAVCQTYLGRYRAALHTRNLMAEIKAENLSNRLELAKLLNEAERAGKAVSPKGEASSIGMEILLHGETSSRADAIVLVRRDLLTDAAEERKYRVDALAAAWAAHQPPGPNAGPGLSDDDFGRQWTIWFDQADKLADAPADDEHIQALAQLIRELSLTSEGRFFMGARGLESTLAAMRLNRMAQPVDSPCKQPGAKEYQEAIDSARRSAAANPADGWRRSTLAYAFFQMGDFDLASRTWEIATALNKSDRVSVSNMLAGRLSEYGQSAMGKAEKAALASYASLAEVQLSEWENAADPPAGPQVDELRYQLGNAYWTLSDPLRALPYLMACVRREHNTAFATFFAGRSFLRLRRFDEAENLWKEGVRKLNCAAFGKETVEIELNEENLKKLRQPNSEGIPYYRAYTLLYLGRAEAWGERGARLGEALELLEKVEVLLQHCGDMPDIRAALYEVKGWNFFRQGLFEQAQAQLLESHNLTSDAVVEYRLAACLTERARQDEARRADFKVQALFHARLARSIGLNPWYETDLQRVEDDLAKLELAAPVQQAQA